MLAGLPALALKYDYSSETFKKCYQWLQDHDTANMPEGRYEICEGAYAMVQKYTTVPAEKCRFEAHDAYWDIQYIAAGIEAFGVCTREGLEQTEAIKQNDVVFFKTPEHYTTVVLNPGEMCVVPPEEAHRPRAAVGEPAPVVKVVIKIKA